MFIIVTVSKSDTAFFGNRLFILLLLSTMHLFFQTNFFALVVINLRKIYMPGGQRLSFNHIRDDDDDDDGDFVLIFSWCSRAKKTFRRQITFFSSSVMFCKNNKIIWSTIITSTTN